ncbi:MAG: hypothetical protein G01um101416_1079, partial [Microgenomates group bacterium Gr01-1014_16]
VIVFQDQCEITGAGGEGKAYKSATHAFF